MRPKRAALWVWLHKVMRNNDFSLPGRSYIIGKSIGSALSSLPSCLCHCRCSVQTMRHGKQLQPMESTLLQVFTMVPVPPPQATMSISMVVGMDQVRNLVLFDVWTPRPSSGRNSLQVMAGMLPWPSVAVLWSIMKMQ